MGTIYKAGDGTIFECKLWHEENGTRYALDTTNVTEILAYPLNSLTNLGETFDFIIRFLPNYSQSTKVAILDDIDCLIGNECDPEKLEHLTSIYGSDPTRWNRVRDAIFEEVLKQAISAYKEARK